MLIVDLSDSKVGCFSCLKSVSFFYAAATSGDVGSSTATDFSDGSGSTSTFILGIFYYSICTTGLLILIGFERGLEFIESVLLDLCDMSSLCSPISQSGLKRLTGAMASCAALERFNAPPCLFSSFFLAVGDIMFMPAFWKESLKFPYIFKAGFGLRGENGSLGKISLMPR